MAPAAGAADNKSIANAIHSDEEWSAFLEKPGLKVLDVYAKWAGPCEAMQSIFKRMKLDFADGLQFYQVSERVTKGNKYDQIYS